ncbi:MAG: ABC transporter substrate-binding protein [Deltaproteobacteria bacterium]|nr:ABC transporter substrate-binding protein [Deltaproteobacteria bacterium]
MMDKRWINGAILFAVVLLLSADMATAAGRGVTDDTIKLGLVLVKTGPVAALGLPNGQGMVDYMKYINDGGGINGRKVEIIWEDDQFQAPKSVAAVKKLMTRDEVLTIITTGGTTQTIANLGNIQNYKITNIPNALAVEFYEPLNPYIFAMGATYEAQYQCIVDYIHDDLGIEDPRIGVVYTKKEYGKVGLDAIKDRAKKYDIPVVAELVMPTGAVDASSQVLALQKADANIVITCDVLPPVISFVKTTQKYAYTPVIFGFNWATDDMIVKACGEGAKNYIGVNFVGGWSDDSPGLTLVREIAAKYGAEPGLTSLYVNGVGVAWLFVEAMKRAGENLNPDTLKEAMETLSDYETGGIFPPVTYTHQSHAPSEKVKFFKADVPNNRLVPITDWRSPKQM